MNKLLFGSAVAVGLVAAGLALAGVAAAAPSDAPPAATAPASADAPPVPVPVVNQPVDARDGLYGVRRGSVPTASTSDLKQVPILDQLPVIGVTPLPDNGDEEADGATEETTEETDGSATPAPDTDASTAQ
jgi:hypothetical protein